MYLKTLMHLSTHCMYLKTLMHFSTHCMYLKTLVHLSTHCMYLPQMYVEFHNRISLLHFQLTSLNTRDRWYYIFTTWNTALTFIYLQLLMIYRVFWHTVYTIFLFHQHVCSWAESTVFVQCKGNILRCHVHRITQKLIDADKYLLFKNWFFILWDAQHASCLT
jgi:hypothetical protein